MREIQQYLAQIMGETYHEACQQMAVTFRLRITALEVRMDDDMTECPGAFCLLTAITRVSLAR